MASMVDNIENMNKRTKTILSVVGVCAVVIPALLLWYLSSHARQEPQISKNNRPVGALNVQAPAQSKPKVPTVVSTPTPAATSSAAPQSTSSAR